MAELLVRQKRLCPGILYETSDTTNDEVDYNPDATAILNARFTAVISKFEISYTIENVMYAARSFMENIVGPLMDEEISLTPSPYYMPPTRMVYLLHPLAISGLAEFQGQLAEDSPAWLRISANRL
jgi:hypothetical protein